MFSSCLLAGSSQRSRNERRRQAARRLRAKRFGELTQKLNRRLRSRMRRTALYLLGLLLSSSNIALAQGGKVRVSSLLLTQERAGWRVDFPAGAPSKYSLQKDDLLIRIDNRNAKEVGPLGVLAAFNAAFSRAVPLMVQRGSQQMGVTSGDRGEPLLSQPPRHPRVS